MFQTGGKGMVQKGVVSNTPSEILLRMINVMDYIKTVEYSVIACGC